MSKLFRRRQAEAPGGPTRSILKTVRDGDDGWYDELRRTVLKHNRRDRRYRATMRKVAMSVHNRRDPQRSDVYQLLLRSMGSRSPERLMMFARRAGIDTTEVASFQECCTKRVHQKQQSRAYAPELPIINKRGGYRFADAIGVRRPAEYGDYPIRLAELPFVEGTVVKPVSGEGSRCVFIVRSSDEIVDVRRAEKLSSETEMRGRLADDLADLPHVPDKWIVEEYVVDAHDRSAAARDLKFYCFYGQVGLVLEVVRWPSRVNCWWTRDGQLTSTGKYANAAFVGQGISEDQVAQAERVSSEIPAPYVRLDFLKGPGGLVLNEFAGHPGSYELFNHATDVALGNMFLDAEGRIVRDLLGGKRFEAFQGCFAQNPGLPGP